jgi:hypothetical protein
MNTLSQDAIELARRIRDGLPGKPKPPEDGISPNTENVIPFSVIRGTRGYIEKVTNQVNGAYENGWFDACAVMIRRLIETLIIEVFEHHRLANKIMNSSGDFLPLSELVEKILDEPSWNLGRATKHALPKLKAIGDMSAHSRRYTAHRQDIEKVFDDLRVVVQELVYLAGLK